MNVVDSRIEKLRGLMRANDIGLYVIPTSDPHGSEYINDYYKCREYMSGFTGSAGTLVVSQKEAALFVDGRYHIQADEETSGTCIKVFKMGVSGVPSLSDYINSIARSNDTVAFDGRIMMAKNAENLTNKISANVNIELDLVSYIYEERKEITPSEIIILDKKITGKSTEDKLSEVRKIIRTKCADGYFISSLDDICYLFNFRGNDISYSTVAFAYAYITAESATLFLMNGAFNNNIADLLGEQGVYIADYRDIEQELFKVKSKTIIIDPEYTSAYFSKVIGLGNDVVFADNYESIRKHVKNETEQNLARKYAITDAVAMIEFIVKIKKSVSDGEDYDEYSAGKLLDSIRQSKEDFFNLSFETICAYSENAAIVHYSAKSENAKKLEKKGLLLVDSGSHYFGATTDITRTITLGHITDEEKRAFTLVLKGNLKLMDAIFIKGTRCENLDILAREALWKEGLDYRHGTGHGIGSFLNVHEGPYRIGYKIREDMKQPQIEAGMIISDEPGYYEATKFGIRHETQLLCVNKMETEYGQFGGFEPLSLVPFDKDAIDFSLLTSEELGILNTYNHMIMEKVVPKLNNECKKWVLDMINYVD